MDFIKKIFKEALTADIQNYKQRIDAGKAKEKMIIDQLRGHGIKIDEPTSQEDMYEKIDGWIYDKNGTRASVQIKFRESGDDIIFEIVKDLDRDIPGRDLISKAEYYLVVNRDGIGRLIATKAIKDKAHMILERVKKDLLAMPSKTRWQDVGWEAKITQDRAHGQNKLMAYFNPKMFTILGSWKFKL